MNKLKVKSSRDRMISRWDGTIAEEFGAEVCF